MQSVYHSLSILAQNSLPSLVIDQSVDSNAKFPHENN